MNESAAAPPNTEHELLLETGRFWSRYFFTSRHPHLPIHFSSEVTRGLRKDLLFSISRRVFATSTRHSVVWGGKAMGDPNRPLVGEVHRPEPLGNCRKSAAQFLGQLPGGHKWIGKDQLMKSFLINRAGAAGGKITFIHWLSLCQLLVVLKKGGFTDTFSGV